MSGEMFWGKYAQKDASKVNMYEIAQLSRASAAPAKSCAEVERTSKREKLRGEEAETQRKKCLCLMVSEKQRQAGCFVRSTSSPPYSAF